jgi:hypothetical protein
MKTINSCLSCEGTILNFREYDENPMSGKARWPKEHCFSNKKIAVCSDCGFGFTYEYLSDDEISEFYNNVYSSSHASDNAPRVSSLNELTPRFFSQTLYLNSNIDLYDGIRVLEIGPNQVSALPAMNLFCKPQYSYYDQLEWPIIKSHGGRCLGSYASGDRILKDFSENSLDLVYSSHSLEHINPSALEDMFDAFSHVITSGGYLFFEVPDDYLFELLGPPHTLFFTKNSIKKLVKRHGFDIVNLSHWDGGARFNKNNIDSDENSIQVIEKNIASRLRSVFRKIILNNESIARIIKPFRLRRALPKALRNIPNPYDSVPYYRVLAKKI